ncbi:MAG: 50S ribosomal protein L29 [Candidatus Paceibacterota bacterium]
MSDLQKTSEKDLLKNLADLREKVRVLRFGKAGSGSRNVREGRNIRKQIARVATELSARQK